MSIYLSQHGKSASKEVDPRRGLTPEGSREVASVAQALARAGVAVREIWHSGKARADESAQIFAASLAPTAGVRSRDGVDPLDDVIAFAESLPKNGDVMVVGHLPFMERLVSFLVTGEADGRVVRFQNGAVVCMDWDTEGDRWVIDWTVYPKFQVD